MVAVGGVGSGRGLVGQHMETIRQFESLFFVAQRALMMNAFIIRHQ